MAKLLISLHSKVDDLGALGIFDTDLGLTYLQIDELSPQIHRHQVRGVAVLGNRIYAVTTASLRLYTLSPSQCGPWLKLDREVIFPEWLAGRNSQADLLPLFLSERRERLFVGCNNLGTLDELDLNGNLIARRHLSQILVDDLFSTKCKKSCPYGHIRNITESPMGDIVLTIAYRSGLDYGSVVNVDTGEILLDCMEDPHGGLYSSNLFYFLDVLGGQISAHHQREGRIGENCWFSKPNIGESTANVNLRGMAKVDDIIFSSVLNFEKDVNKWIPSKVVAFDAFSGKQDYLKVIPDLDVFRRSRTFFIAGLDNALKIPCSDKIVAYKYGAKIDVTEIKRSVSQKVAGLPENAESVLSRPSSQREIIKSNSSSSSDIVAGAATQANDVVRKDNKAIISLQGVSLSYHRGAYFGFGKKRHLRTSRKFWALNGISFDIYEGEVVGLIGRNGSGKSTLGMLINGSLTADLGSVKKAGKAQLLSLGVGFRGELTGRDNVFINGTLLGLRRAQIYEQMEDIEAFSELNEFIDEPVRTYSAGMKSRLAFAVATAVEPDILILDEVLSTGDQSFRKKAEKRMRAMQGKAKTILMVSHNTNQLRKMCSRVIWLDYGKLMLDGEPKSVLEQYENFCQNPDKWLNQNRLK